MSMQPTVQEIQEETQAATIAADAVVEIGEVVVFHGGTVTKVAYVPVAAIAGTNLPNSRHLTLYNKTQARQVATLQLAAGVNPAAGAETAIPITNGAVTQGDVLEWQSTHDGTGLVDPGGMVIVEITRAST